MDCDSESLRVERAVNGWVVFADFGNRDAIGSMYVARTPEQLAEMLRDWAQRQLPKTFMQEPQAVRQGDASFGRGLSGTAA